ncbi:MAG: M18 family aminopeptidase [Muribaculaceae bacterium]|nr:M18 family aminopeptidase [Muribaculaceae bacterium]
MTPLTRDLCDFLDASPCNFLAVRNLAERLEGEGFVCLDFRNRDALETGGKYYYTVNGSALIAFIVGEGEASEGFKIISAHSDSPGFRIKPNAEMMCPGRILKLNTEVYGGPILYTWFDRPLSISGRVILRNDADPLRPEIITMKIDRPLLTIPHLAIHFNRQVNDGNPLSKQKDMLPVLAKLTADMEADNFLLKLIAEECGCDISDILDFDLTLYDTTKACTFGADNEFISSGRLDDLSMVHAGLTALLATDPAGSRTRVLAIFDNEETGSGTKQGAASPILDMVLRRVVEAKGGDEISYQQAVANSFMVSADNAHAVHPNYVEKQDPTNHPALGDGPVIKINANCKYMTDADSAAVFRAICERAGVPVQYFVNHSDVAGGSTLGNILTSQIPLRGVDMGAALWAMHSVRETASVADHAYIVDAFTEFYNI